MNRGVNEVSDRNEYLEAGKVANRYIGVHRGCQSSLNLECKGCLRAQQGGWLHYLIINDYRSLKKAATLKDVQNTGAASHSPRFSVHRKAADMPGAISVLEIYDSVLVVREGCYLFLFF